MRALRRLENPEQEDQRALDHMRRVIDLEGPSTIAAVILEMVPGAAGVLTPPRMRTAPCSPDSPDDARHDVAHLLH
ncbi:hypothetical protein GCM10009789_12540 [Kribbella sancticallisti]|uniref:Uncharacterized protein n=1 Tax=Kribbella sancticallisti TaxID=460087 RepID=A0ABP4NL25_9ACTN